MRACSICANPQAAAIDAELAGGASIRATARKFGVPRTTLARHAGHAAPIAESPPATDPNPTDRDAVRAALGQLDRARTERDRLRALEAVRQSLRLEMRDHSRTRAALRPPTEAQIAELEANLQQAWQAFEDTKDRGHDLADRALSGVRSALEALRQAQAVAAGEQIRLMVHMPVPGSTPHEALVSASTAFDQYGVPPELRSTEYALAVHLNPFGQSLAELIDTAGEVVWSRTAGGPLRLADLNPNELPPPDPKGGNGNGHDEEG